MRTLVCLLMFGVALCARAEEPDYKALYLRANEAAAQWKAKAEEAEQRAEDLEASARTLQVGLRARAAEVAALEARLAAPPPAAPTVPAVPAVTPAAEHVPAREPVTVRRAIPGNTWVHLVNYGGPNQHIMLTDVQLTYLHVRFRHTGKARQYPIDITAKRVLIHDDRRGCKTWFVVDNMERPTNGAIFEFEHTADSAWYPGHGIRGGRDRDESVQLPVAVK